jgi:hypothetical protein
MAGINDGGSAFPPNAGWRDDDADARGMSLRDWFAGQAMARLVSTDGGPAMDTWERLAAASYDAADAMLAERSKKEPA